MYKLVYLCTLNDSPKISSTCKRDTEERSRCYVNKARVM